MNRLLKVATGNFDRTNTFAVEVRGYRAPLRVVCSLRRDYEQVGDGILWALQHCGVIASSYSQDEIDERDRLNSEAPLRHGDIVTVEGKSYRINVKGNYSSAAILEPVAPQAAWGA